MKELGGIEIRKLIIKHALKVDFTQPIHDADGQLGTGVNIFRRIWWRDGSGAHGLYEAFWTDWSYGGDGFGRIIYNDGSHYTGEFKELYRNGQGILIDEYGKRQEGKW